jgi:hypothetical protein
LQQQDNFMLPLLPACELRHRLRHDVQRRRLGAAITAVDLSMLRASDNTARPKLRLLRLNAQAAAKPRSSRVEMR